MSLPPGQRALDFLFSLRGRGLVVILDGRRGNWVEQNEVDEVWEGEKWLDLDIKGRHCSVWGGECGYWGDGLRFCVLQHGEVRFGGVVLGVLFVQVGHVYCSFFVCHFWGLSSLSWPAAFNVLVAKTKSGALIYPAFGVHNYAIFAFHTYL